MPEDADRLRGAGRAGLRSVPYGDPTDPDVFMKPLITAEQRERVLGYVERGRAEGARLVVGARAFDDRGPGFYVEPTLFADVDPAAAIAQEEILRPVFSLIAYEDEDDAVRIANDTVYGLAGHVWGADPDRAVGVARRLGTGMVAVNGGPLSAPSFPSAAAGRAASTASGASPASRSSSS